MTVHSTSAPMPQSVVGSQLVRTWQAADPRATVVVVHGLAEHSGRYEHVGQSLAAAGFTATAFDLIGFGATGGRRAYVEDWAQYLDQVQEHLEPAREEERPVVLLGHSMGGLIALGYALSERPRPDILVLSAPSLGGGSSLQRAVAPIAARVAGTIRVPNGLSGDQLSRDPEVGEAYFSDPLVHTSSTVRLGAELFAAIERTARAMARLDVPTLVLHGGLDSVVPPTATVALGALPNVERRLYPALRHELFNEPEGPTVLEEVTQWLDEKLDRL